MPWKDLLIIGSVFAVWAGLFAAIGKGVFVTRKDLAFQQVQCRTTLLEKIVFLGEKLDRMDEKREASKDVLNQTLLNMMRLIKNGKTEI